MIRDSFKYKIGRLIGNEWPTIPSADYRPVIGRLAKPKTCRPMEKKYNKVLYFLLADKKELKSGTLSADKSADCRPTVGGVNVIAVLRAVKILNSFKFPVCSSVLVLFCCFLCLF